MRVIAGALGGRLFESPHGHRTHPMSEKIRGAIFNALGDIADMTVLDVYSGSGALCFEALSRGAKSAVALDADKAAYTCIKRNAINLGVYESMTINCIYANSWHTRHPKDVFNLVFLDPPYDAVEPETTEKLALHTKTGGIAVFSLPPGARIVLADTEFTLLSRKEYGDATLAFYRRIA